MITIPRRLLRQGFLQIESWFHLDAIVFLHAIAVAGDWSPVGELAAGAENVFLFIGAEKSERFSFQNAT